MKYTVAKVVSRDGKLDLVYRAKSGYKFFGLRISQMKMWYGLVKKRRKDLHGGIVVV